MKQIIVCDDDKDIAESIAIFLESEGYKIFQCYNGKEAIECADKNHIDLVIMDIMMPVMDGIETVKKMRETSDIPVLFLSAKSEDEDKILGLTIGGDDYMTKPYNPLELVARVRSILKRSSITKEAMEKTIYQNGDLRIEQGTKTIFLGDKQLNTTPTEYDILLYFMKNVGKILSSNDIYKDVWNQSEAYNIENTIAVHIRHIREKIEKDTKNPKYIKVIWGIGYKMEEIS